MGRYYVFILSVHFHLLELPIEYSQKVRGSVTCCLFSKQAYPIQKRQSNKITNTRLRLQTVTLLSWFPNKKKTLPAQTQSSSTLPPLFPNPLTKKAQDKQTKYIKHLRKQKIISKKVRKKHQPNKTHANTLYLNQTT